MDSQQPPSEFQGAPDPGASSFPLFGAFTRLLNIIGTFLILAIAVAVNADVIGRDFFNRTIPGVVEFIGLSIVAIVFLQMANTLRENRHVTNDVVFAYVEKSHPQLALFCRSVFNFIGAIMMALTTWFVWPMLLENYEGGYYKGTGGLVEIRIWPFFAAVVIGAAVTALQFMLIAVSDFNSALNYKQKRP